MNGEPRGPARALPVVLVAAAAWSFIPLAIWWDGADPAYFAGSWQAWGWGTAVATLLALLAVVLSRGAAAVRVLEVWRRLLAVPAPLFVGALCALLAVLAVLMCLLVFAGNPRNVDGFAQLFQARIFLAGRAWSTPPLEVANFATLHMIVGPTRWFAQYPPGQSAVLAGGLSLGAWWLLNPLFAALLGWATWRAGRWCVGESAARLALVLLCLSPFVIAVSGSEMSHLPAAALGMLAAALATWSGGSRGRLAALSAGAALGLMTAFRPLDAVAAAAPVALVLGSASTRPRVGAFLAVIVGGVAGTVPTLAFNQATTGSWHLFGYTYLWGAGHSLGFHPVPWGVPLTLTRAIARSGLDLHQLNTYLFDLPFPVLLLAAIGMLAGRRRLEERDAVPLLGAGALVGLLFFYWHRDVFYGPRLLFSAVPWVVIMVARAVVLLRRSGPEWRPGITAGLAALTAVATAFAVGLATIAPDRLAAYRAATPVFSLHPDRDAQRAGIGHAVVVIPDGWGSRLIARMWALGVPVRRSTRLYAGIDACTLQLALDAAEDASTPPALLLDRLDSLLVRWRPGIRSGATQDLNLRLPPPQGRPSPTATLGVIPSQNLLLPPDSALAPACRAELAFDQRGFLAYAPFLYLNNASLDGDVVWARDLGAGNAPLFRRYRGRRFYRYAPEVPGGRPVLTPLEAPTANGLP